MLFPSKMTPEQVAYGPAAMKRAGLDPPPPARMQGRGAGLGDRIRVLWSVVCHPRSFQVRP